jgi:hypothetical protein
VDAHRIGVARDIRTYVTVVALVGGCLDALDHAGDLHNGHWPIEVITRFGGIEAR